MRVKIQLLCPIKENLTRFLSPFFIEQLSSLPQNNEAERW